MVSVRGVSGGLCGAAQAISTAWGRLVTKLFFQTGAVRLLRGEGFSALQVPRLARDLDIPIGIIAFPTRREADGLAMSSRNSQAVGRTAQSVAAPKRNSLEAAERLAPPREAVFAAATRSLPPATESLNISNYGPAPRGGCTASPSRTNARLICPSSSPRSLCRGPTY